MSVFYSPFSSRRRWLQSTACGFGSLALAGLLADQDARAGAIPATHRPHFAPRAKRMIFVFLQGSPSQIDTFDYKPRLQKDDGKPVAANTGNPTKYLGSPWKFSQHGNSGHTGSRSSILMWPSTPTSFACSRA